MSDIWQLRSADWMRELSDADVARLRSKASGRIFQPGATVFSPETKPHSVYLLESGLVRIYRLTKDGGETSFGYVPPGEIFGELTAFGDFPRESFAVSVHPSRVWKIPAAPFHHLLEERPKVVLLVTRQIGRRMKRMETRVERLVFRDVRARVAGTLLELGEDFGEPRGEQIALDIELTQSELASLVGSTRQTVNASLGELETAGLIERNGRRLLIVKPMELARAARATNHSG